jgi:hypothetical protein
LLKRTLMTFSLLSLVCFSVLAQVPNGEKELFHFMGFFCADGVDAKNMSNVFYGDLLSKNADVEEYDKFADEVIENINEGQYIWPSFDNLELWFSLDISANDRLMLVSWMYILRAKKDFFKAYRPDLIEALDYTEFPWKDEKLLDIKNRFDVLYKMADEKEKKVLDKLLVHLMYRQLVELPAVIDLELIEFSLFNKNTLVNLSEALNDCVISHEGDFKYINKMFKSSPDDYEKYVDGLNKQNDKERLVFSNIKYNVKKNSSLILGTKMVTREQVMLLLDQYKINCGLEYDSEDMFTSEKVLSLLTISMDHNSALASEDVKLLFGINGSGGLYSYLYQNLAWQNNYEDFFILTVILASQLEELGVRENQLLVMDGAKRLGILGEGLSFTNSSYKDGAQLESILNRSSFVNEFVTKYNFNEMLLRVQTGYSLLRVMSTTKTTK